MSVSQANWAYFHLINDNVDKLITLERAMGLQDIGALEVTRAPRETWSLFELAYKHSNKSTKCIRWLASKRNVAEYVTKHESTLLDILVTSGCRDFSLIYDTARAIPLAMTNKRSGMYTPMDHVYSNRDRVAMNALIMAGSGPPTQFWPHCHDHYCAIITAHVACRAASVAMIRCLTPALGRDMARLVGQYVHNTRCYEEWTSGFFTSSSKR